MSLTDSFLKTTGFRPPSKYRNCSQIEALTLTQILDLDYNTISKTILTRCNEREIAECKLDLLKEILKLPSYDVLTVSGFRKRMLKDTRFETILDNEAREEAKKITTERYKTEADEAYKKLREEDINGIFAAKQKEEDKKLFSEAGVPIPPQTQLSPETIKKLKSGTPNPILEAMRNYPDSLTKELNKIKSEEAELLSREFDGGRKKRKRKKSSKRKRKTKRRKSKKYFSLL